MGQVWGTNTLGGYMYSDNLSEYLRTALQPMLRFRQFCDAQDGTMLSEHMGATFNWNIYSDIGTQGGQLTEEVPMPESNFTVAQGTKSVAQYGNSVPFTALLDSHSEHPVKEVIKKVLKNDANKTLEAAAHTEFDSTLLNVQPTGGNSATAITVEATGTPAAANALAMNNVHVQLISDEMKERDIPVYDGTNYMCIGRPKTFRAFKNDLESFHQYVDDGYTRILRGEVGRSYEGIRFFEQTGISSEGWSGAVSDAAYFFGADTVTECQVIPEEIRGKIPTDFGLSKAIAWYFLGGFALIHNETGAADNRVMKWDSAS